MWRTIIVILACACCTLEAAHAQRAIVLKCREAPDAEHHIACLEAALLAREAVDAAETQIDPPSMQLDAGPADTQVDPPSLKLDAGPADTKVDPPGMQLDAGPSEVMPTPSPAAPAKRAAPAADPRNSAAGRPEAAPEIEQPSRAPTPAGRSVTEDRT